MPSCELTIPNEEGLHARPAAKFVKLANRFPCEIWVEKDDEEINGKSIMGLMMLAAAKGSVITGLNCLRSFFPYFTGIHKIWSLRSLRERY